MSFPDWIERQISNAERDGAFENLPGKGKPIQGLDQPQHELAWIVGKLRAENVDMTAALPPALALAREVELLPEKVATCTTEARVREVVTDLNARIRHAYLAPQVGPPMRVRSVDVDEVVAQWRATRPARRPAPVPQPAAEPRRRRWFRRTATSRTPPARNRRPG